MRKDPLGCIQVHLDVFFRRPLVVEFFSHIMVLTGKYCFFFGGVVCFPSILFAVVGCDGGFILLGRAAGCAHVHILALTRGMQATQQYFDHHGFFLSMVVCMPVLLNLIFLTLIWVYNAGSMLIAVKRAELRLQAKSRKSSAEGDVAAAADAGDALDNGGEKRITRAAAAAAAAAQKGPDAKKKD